MKGINFDELKFRLNVKSIDEDIKKLRSKINENLDEYFIDENKEVYDTMMKNYTGDKHKTFQDTNAQDFVKYNDYKNSFLDKFKK